jgi:hypothetical protein
LDSSGTVGDPAAARAVRRDLAFMCADSGSVVALTFTQERRPVLLRAVVFLSAGQTFWVDPASAAGTLEVRDESVAGRYDLRLSAQAALLTSASEIVSEEPVIDRRLPVTVDVTLEPVSLDLKPRGQDPGSAEPAHVVMVRVSGSLGVGSVIYPLHATGWSSSQDASAADDQADYRARAVFQDGSGLFATRGPDVAASGGDTAGDGTAAGKAAAEFAALVVNTQISQVPVLEFSAQGRVRGPARKVQWAGGRRQLSNVTGEIRNAESEHVTFVRPAASGDGWLAWSCAPVVFVRSGIPGLGLMERQAAVSSAHAPLDTRNRLPDPY